jgi:hypothetical protein
MRHKNKGLSVSVQSTYVCLYKNIDNSSMSPAVQGSIYVGVFNNVSMPSREHGAIYVRTYNNVCMPPTHAAAACSHKDKELSMSAHSIISICPHPCSSRV